MNYPANTQQHDSNAANIDYSYYIQRGRQEQAHAIREVFSALVRQINHYGVYLLTAAKKRNDAWQYSTLPKPTQNCCS